MPVERGAVALRPKIVGLFPAPNIYLPSACVLASVEPDVGGTPDAIERTAARLAASLSCPEMLTPDSEVPPACSDARLLMFTALALQRHAGYEVRLGRVLDPQEGSTAPRIAVEALWSPVGMLAIRSAALLWARLLQGQSADPHPVIRDFLKKAATIGPGSGIRYFLREARRRGVPATLLDKDTVRFGQGRHARVMYKTLTDRTPYLAVLHATNKTRVLSRFSEIGIPVPRHIPVSAEKAALDAAEQIGWPVVVKPTTSDWGLGVSVGVKTPAEAARAYNLAKQHGPVVAVEEFIPGETYRLLVIDGRFAAASRTSPAAVTGDGRSSLRALVVAANRDPRRGPGHSKPLSWIEPDETTASLLAKEGLSWEAVPEAGREVLLHTASNLSRGGTSVAVTGLVHPENAALAEAAARALGLDIAGIDVRGRSIDAPLTETGGAVIEINPKPGLRMHYAPAVGPAIDVAEPIFRLLFAGHRAGVPSAAITGTNGKTTTTRLLAHILTAAGYRTGRITSGEVAVGDRILKYGDCAGPIYARQILAHPEVEAAVLETARGGIVKYGLGFETCDAAAVLNVADDHIGKLGIASLDEMAQVKRLVAGAATGTLVLNADDPRCLAMAENRRAQRVILFSLDQNSAAVSAQSEAGGISYLLTGTDADARVERACGNLREPVLDVGAIPIAFNGAARYGIANAMAAMALAEALGISGATVKEAVQSFKSDFENNPGRMNRYRGLPFEVVLDYAHNMPGFKEVLPALAQIPVPGRRICCAILGGQHDDVKLREMTAYLAPHFDRFVPSNRANPAKRREELPEVARQGLKAAGVADDNIRPRQHEREGIATALDWAEPGDLVVILGADEARSAWTQVITYVPRAGPGASRSASRGRMSLRPRPR